MGITDVALAIFFNWRSAYMAQVECREIKIKLIGGPFDGDVLTGPWPVPYCLAATWHPEEPVYRCIYCECCAGEMDELEYKFIGYKPQLEAEKMARNAKEMVEKAMKCVNDEISQLL